LGRIERRAFSPLLKERNGGRLAAEFIGVVKGGGGERRGETLGSEASGASRRHVTIVL
jgi:hypothetical protein